MKKTKRLARKFLLILSSALLLVSLTVGATVAYLTDTDSVVNTFTVGKVGLSMDEADVNEYGDLIYTDEAKTILAERVTANEYKLIPGHTYVKDPTIYIDSTSEDGWLFVKIDNQIADIEDQSWTIAAQMAQKGFKPIAEGSNVYAWDYVATKANTSIVVFEKFKIDGNVKNAALAEYQGKSVSVTAYMVQKDGFDNAKAAWDATFAKDANYNIETPDVDEGGSEDDA